MSQHTHVNLAFPVHGRSVPVDHSYALYAALSRIIPAIHHAEWIAIQAIAAPLGAPDTLTLDPRGTLRLRVPADRIALLIGLAGARFDLGGHVVELGAPTVHSLIPAATLDARLVLIKLTAGLGKPFDRAKFEAGFLAEAQHQLIKEGVVGEIELCGRQRLTVAGRRVIGYSTRVGGLSAEHSLKLQVVGLGGKRTMGCGIFRPARIKEQARRVA